MKQDSAAGTCTRICSSEADADALAQRLATSAALAHATLHLHGDLGAGKTTFVRLLLRALGVGGRIKSPSYAIVEPHLAPARATWPEGLAISHFDFYRFNDPREWEEAGLRELFAAPGLKLVEWPEKAAGWIPLPDMELHIAPQDDDARAFHFRALSPTGARLLETLRP
ncbi:tRNA (adenosine(37)-N6)-threonylcarbamoyltransferase complex ATPase subunit type 1 TsaE [Tepidicella xavieri]|uniref:tRNA threonylcarbamoyladenosine biosynthesis protein TsaE n=1 Tax=Tepidicella xavieri TaxID=360241 RepID=A0A4R6U922_9BURK|nr:tRNA (adenosine(37)-N6)-threonylcarbamoyltransferase complex ATPase subunit type 1 TsaE [Tepidicella xavieri]TDQ43078.1 tRNA threonylcarbamoyladenosine biosynthesis protein TsaE [Tepidicella xavieri]